MSQVPKIKVVPGAEPVKDTMPYGLGYDHSDKDAVARWSGRSDRPPSTAAEIAAAEREKTGTQSNGGAKEKV